MTKHTIKTIIYAIY